MSQRVSGVLSSWLGTVRTAYGQCYEMYLNGRRAVVCAPFSGGAWVAAWGDGQEMTPEEAAALIAGAKADWPGADDRRSQGDRSAHC